MKSKLLLLLPFLLLFAACKKGGTAAPAEQEVTIGGDQHPTVRIGTQEWTADNYNGPGGVVLTSSGANPKYKKYYTLADLKDLKLPTGWRIPTIADYNKLMSNFSSRKDTEGNIVMNYDETLALRSTTNWEIRADDKVGTNTSGFNAYPAGYYTPYPDNETQGNLALFLTSTTLPPAKVTPQATYYSFIITRLAVTASSDNETVCYTCFLNTGHNTDAPKSVRFVRDR